MRWVYGQPEIFLADHEESIKCSKSIKYSGHNEIQKIYVKVSFILLRLHQIQSDHLHIHKVRLCTLCLSYWETSARQ
ncbi:hypothetical protein Leryth_021968 [Lithospermum erythrorhizon]|nr:hypothetical protein Leryth_021968 [Lithospermum erythrorhizon]